MIVQIGYGQIDPSAKSDSTPTSNDKQAWDDLSSLKLDGLEVKNIATCEHNQAILDGKQEHLPDNPEIYQWGFWSIEPSDDDGLFDNPPALDIRFIFNHKSPGLTFLFYPHTEDWAENIRVTWLDGSDTVIHTGEYVLSGTTSEIEEEIVNFRRIIIEFLSTNIRNRYVKLAGINYGKGRSFSDGDIDSVSLLEEVDPTSNEITINTFNFRIRTHAPEFSMVQGLGDDMLMRNQPISVIADGEDFGSYFLKFPWKDVHGDGTVIDFQAVDPIGAMDQYQFWGGVYRDVPLEALIGQIFSVCFPTQLIRYQIDPAFDGVRLSGRIPICTCREALQLICFSIGAIADDSRRSFVWIYPPDTEVSYIIPSSKIYKGPGIEPTTYYNGVDVVTFEYVESDEFGQAHDGEMEAGQHTLKFNEPLYDLSAAGAVIIKSSANYAVINVLEAGAVAITGKKYIVNNMIFSAREEVEAGEVENIRIYDKCTMLSPAQGQVAADRLFNYLRQRTRINPDLRLEKEGDYADKQSIEYLEVGEMAQVPTIGWPINGTIEQLDINLRAGKARAKVIGNVDKSDN